MKKETIDAVKAVLHIDSSVSPAELQYVMAALRNAGKKLEAKPPQQVRLLRRTEVASRLGVSLRAIDSWARQGILRKVKLPGRIRACGFSSVDIERIAEGRVGASDAAS